MNLTSNKKVQSKRLFNAYVKMFGVTKNNCLAEYVKFKEFFYANS